MAALFSGLLSTEAGKEGAIRLDPPLGIPAQDACPGLACTPSQSAPYWAQSP